MDDPARLEERAKLGEDGLAGDKRLHDEAHDGEHSKAAVLRLKRQVVSVTTQRGREAACKMHEGADTLPSLP